MTPNTVSVFQLPGQQNGWTVGLMCVRGHGWFTDGRFLTMPGRYVVRRGAEPGRWEFAGLVNSYSKAECVLDRWASEHPTQWASIECRGGTAFEPVRLAERRPPRQDAAWGFSKSG